jgi:hypothetical protein
LLWVQVLDLLALVAASSLLPGPLTPPQEAQCTWQPEQAMPQVEACQ